MSHFDDYDPSTGQVLETLRSNTPAEVADAVARARTAAASWSQMPFDERAARIAAVADELTRAADELAELVTREMGKPAAEAMGEVSGRAKGIESSIAAAREALAPEVRTENGAEQHLLREPLGVVACIAPWNFPVGMPMSLLLPALLAGNTVVFKPSEMVPLTGARLAQCFQNVLPEGVLELVQGAGDVGAALVDADVDMVAFVGSRDTGQKIMQACSKSLKRLVLELGGKDPLVVFEDADLDAAADCAVRHSLRNAGQVCCSVERVHVAESVADAFEAKVLEKAREWTTAQSSGAQSSGARPKGVQSSKVPSGAGATAIGPMVSSEQRDKVQAQVTDARERGARVLLGGEVEAGDGYFYPPTVVADVEPEMQLWNQETFGPVVTLTRFSGSDEDAIRIANDTEYGLGANVYTADMERGLRIARGIRSGQVGVNRYMTNMSGSPWVGQKQSGFGFIGGVDGYRQFSVPKTISLSRG